jgi:hypothetical protein
MKDNRLIAEFMGLFDEISLDEDSKEKVMKGITEYSKYHTSWDWLMPVIDKCYQEHMSKHIAEAVMTCNINEAYNAVVEFIKEYNDGQG